MDIYRFLKEAEKVEVKMSELYALFSTAFAEDEEVAFLFRKMSHDEELHRELIQFELKLVMGSRQEFHDVDVHFEEIAQVLARLEDILHAPVMITPEDAIRLAMEFEKSMAETHRRKAITMSNPKISKLMRNLGTKDIEHYGFLADFARKRGMLPVEQVIWEVVPVPTETEDLAGAVVDEEKARLPRK